MDQKPVILRRHRFLRVAAALALAVAGHSAGAESPTPIPVEAGSDAVAYCGRVQAAFTREDFASLEATAERARGLAIHLRGGKPELQVFYESLARGACNEIYASLTESAGKARAAIAEHWLGQKPDSVSAKIANAMIWVEYAWAARGQDYANTVSAEQWKAFADRSMRAAQFMRTVDPQSDPQAFLVLLRLARALKVPRPQIDTIFLRARERFPTYLDYYAEYATILLPKWFGRPGEITSFVQWLRAEPGGDVTAMAYARVAERLAWEVTSADIFRDTGLVWEDVHRGFTLLEARDGLDKHGWTTLLYYAAIARDRSVARDAFRHFSHLDQWPNTNGNAQFYVNVLPWMMQRD